MASKFKVFLAVTLVGSIWVAGFTTAGKLFAPEETPLPSSETQSVQEHFSMLAKQQRRLLQFEDYYGDKPKPREVTAILDFTTRSSIPARAPALDGFQTRHVNISLGENSVRRVLASFTRLTPYNWPRTLDVFMGPNKTVRCDLDEEHSVDSVAIYHVESRWKLEMPSPNGRFGWLTTKDNVLLNSDDCLYRQDLYKDGEYYKSLIAVTKPPVGSPKIAMPGQ